MSILRSLLAVMAVLLPATDPARANDDPILPPLVAEPFTGDLQEMRERGQIRALITYSRTDFFMVNQRPRGLAHDFLLEYEKYLNRGIRKEVNKTHILFIPVTFDQLIPSLLAGKGDLAAGILTLTPEREKQVGFATRGALKINELVVSHKSVGELSRLDDLAGRRMYVLRGSSYAEHLRLLNRGLRVKGLAPVEIVEADSYLLTEDILELVNAGVVEITVADDYKARLWSQVLPDIRVHDEIRISRDNTAGFAVRHTNPRLKESLEAFLDQAKVGTLLGNMLFKRYYENTRWIKNPTSESERDKLRKYRALFTKYGEAYGFDHRALAAQAYRESRLDHGKRSNRGAVGIMQLLPSTAADPNVGVPDIHKLENNIHAGAKYLAFLRDRYFSGPDISDTDRRAFTWAAYNAGPAKVTKMRQRTEAMGLDPNRWFGNVELAAAELVGRETVKYVADIYKYYVAYFLLERLEQRRQLAREQVED